MEKREISQKYFSFLSCGPVRPPPPAHAHNFFIIFSSPLPHSASIDFTDRMMVDTRDYNHEHGSQTGKLAAL